MDTKTTITIRPEHPADEAAIRAINDAAFGQPGEGELVDALRRAGAITLSLVAEDGEHIVGHILFSPARIEGAERAINVVALGPVAVRPDRQGEGIGSQLIKEGLAQLRAAGHDLVILIGHRDYYPRFGFVPGRTHNITCEFDVPDDVFMLLPLHDTALEGITGTAHYRPEFRAVS